MSEAPLPLDPDLEKVLRAERQGDVAPRASRDRVFERLEASMAAAVALGAAGAAGSSALAGGGAGLRWLMRPAVKIVLAFLVGGAAGAGATRALTPSAPPQIVYVERPATAATVAASDTPSADEAASADTQLPAAPTASAPASRPSAASSARSAGPDQLGAERALLDVARTALGRGDGEAALVALAKHQQRFPHGQLAEEREAIAAQALILQKRFGDARARGDAFRRRYPDSVLAPAVNSAMNSIPQ